MNLFIQAATVMAAFAAAHERLIELIRSFNDRLSAAYRSCQPLGAWIDRHTIGPGNVIIAIGMAFATKANLLALFHASKDNAQQAWFFDLFMSDELFSNNYGVSTLAMACGYVLMGLTTALGSQFWHDLANGLVDVRQRVQGVTAQAAPQGVAAQPSTQFVVPASGSGTAPTPVVPPSGPAPHPVPRTDAIVVT